MIRMNANDSRAEFSIYKEALISNGALREIYQGEKATVYSLADVGYGIVAYEVKPESGNSYYVLFCSLEEVKAYMGNEGILYDMMLQKMEKTTHVKLFDDKFDKKLAELNQRRIEQGVCKIDYAKEEEMLASFGLKK